MSSVLPVLRRRWWVIAVSPALALAVAWALAGAPVTSWSIDAVVLVPSGADDEGPGGASEASRLASDYAELIPRDDLIVEHVADEAGWSPEAVREALDVGRVANSALLELSLVRQDPSGMAEAAEALVDAVVLGAGGQRSIPPLFLREVSVEDEPEESTSAALPTLVAATLAGLFLGVAAAVALERSDPRVDDAEIATRRTGVSGSNLDALPDESVLVLLRRWAESCTSFPQTIALLGVERDQLGTTTAAANRLAEVGSRSLDVVASAGDHLEPEPVELRNSIRLDLAVGGAPGTVEAGEWIAADRELAVLVVPSGARLRDVEDATAALRQLDLGPAWVLVTHRNRRRATSARSEWEAKTRSRRAPFPQPAGA